MEARAGPLAAPRWETAELGNRLGGIVRSGGWARGADIRVRDARARASEFSAAAFERTVLPSGTHEVPQTAAPVLTPLSFVTSTMEASFGDPAAGQSTLDEPVLDTLKRDALRVAANVKAVLLPGLYGDAGIHVRSPSRSSTSLLLTLARRRTGAA